MPAAAALANGACRALTSVGAIRIASGLDETTEDRIGICRVGSNAVAPWVLTVTPSLAASVWMPHCMVM